MKRYLILLFALAAAIANNDIASATLVGFEPGRIMDDAVMSDSSAMNTSQIQNFLDSKVSTCDTNGTMPASDWGRPDLTHAQYASLRGWAAPPYTCLKDYVVSDGRTAAQVIYDVSQKYRINPQVMIVLLQKEQGLVTDIWPLPVQYRSATGYGCPDTAPCDSQYYGLVNQLDWAAKMFRSILDQSPYWYSPYYVGDNFIYWSPILSYGGSTVTRQNWATAALYSYTPYQPNQSALNAGYGSGDSCSASGNRNFYNYFTDWFGPTRAGSPYQWDITELSFYKDSVTKTPLTKNTSDAYSLQPGQTAYVVLKAKNTGGVAWDENTILSTTNDPVLGSTDWVARNQITRADTYPVSYGQSATFSFTITAPTTPGVYIQGVNLYQNGVRWFNDVNLVIPVDSVQPLDASEQLPVEDTILKSGASIRHGQTILSPYRGSALTFNEGRVALYIDTELVWSTPTNYAATQFVNQTDGNLVLYDSNWNALWASGSDGKGPGDLYVQTDGNVVLRDPNTHSPIWHTGTAKRDEQLSANRYIAPSGQLFPGQSLSTPDRKYRMVMQTDGNLVIYKAPWRAIWASNTDNRGAERFKM